MEKTAQMLFIGFLVLLLSFSSLNADVTSSWGEGVEPSSSFEWEVVSALGYEENYPWLQPNSSSTLNVTPISITSGDILNLTLDFLYDGYIGEPFYREDGFNATLIIKNTTRSIVLNTVTSYSLMDNFALRIGDFALSLIVPPNWKKLKSASQSPGYDYSPLNYSEPSWSSFEISRDAVQFAFSDVSGEHVLDMIFDKHTGVLLYGYIDNIGSGGGTSITLQITQSTLESFPEGTVDDEDDDWIMYGAVVAVVIAGVAVLLALFKRR